MGGMTDGEPLKSLIPDSPMDEILRAQYKYISSDGNYYILVDFLLDFDNTQYANWSLYQYQLIGDEINTDSPPILSTRSLKKDFDDMIDNENWEERGNETVVCR
jgi:hypothetical protein